MLIREINIFVPKYLPWNPKQNKVLYNYYQR